MSYKVSAYGLSDVGLVRHNNEDVWSYLPETNLYVVADGMGGHQAGEIAAKEAVFNLCSFFKKRKISPEANLEQCKQIIEDVIRETNTVVFQRSLLSDDLRGMGTTLCCILLRKDGLIYAHVGDSRIYRLRNKTLTQLTHDHSLLREMIDSGQLNEDQAEDFHYKNILTKAIGTEPYVDPAIDSDIVLIGDTLLMCTDGLTDMVDEKEIEKILSHSTSSKDAAEKLIKAAKENGGVDNITVIVAKIQENNAPSSLSRP